MVLGPVVQTLDSSIHRINHYPADKYLGNQLRFHWIEIYPADSSIHLLNNWGLVYVLVVFSMQLLFSFFLDPLD